MILAVLLICLHANCVRESQDDCAHGGITIYSAEAYSQPLTYQQPNSLVRHHDIRQVSVLAL